MSEKIYAWLLRLYPSRFREVYGQEALQFVRDRCRDEKGFFPRLQNPAMKRTASQTVRRSFTIRHAIYGSKQTGCLRVLGYFFVVL